MYLDVSPYKEIQAEANDEFAQLAMNRLGGVDMQPSQPTSPVEPGPASPLDYLNQNESVSFDFFCLHSCCILMFVVWAEMFVARRMAVMGFKNGILYQLRLMDVVSTLIYVLLIFFSRKSLKICSRSILIFARFDLSFLVNFSAFLLLKGRQIPLLNSKFVKVTENVIDF